MPTIVYYLHPTDDEVFAHDFGEDTSAAQRATEFYRKNGARNVCISCEPVGMIGRLGVDSIVDGKTPDGQPYEWSKAGRAGRVRRADAPVRNEGEES